MLQRPTTKSRFDILRVSARTTPRDRGHETRADNYEESCAGLGPNTATRAIASSTVAAGRASVRETHQDKIDRATEEIRAQANGNTDSHRDGHRGDADGQGNSSAEDDAREHVTSEFVGAHRKCA